ncbi:uncharacterized protein PFL1_05307 [Pseudozyma flocculosa PF-1]|uniref:Conserved oligomeric Golgi complex subunit 3 n=2 Tax=Pseudozyma flocculosa TaxID=84751 RepID=A0A5C3FF60_9BASI|nr:uncharacterized protein PFL1_05307 [Pseudozyma flocculosa PF-1]EPQ27023.1 hypothetical protein PFL1_05307 [Pseudozyma flocculosa PF-1]SPO42019.1 related to conserved oligomeric Golgi complex component 3 [Pseudozyma flocculosa]
MASYQQHRPSPRAPPLQLDQWSNAKAPLSGPQRTSVNRLADWLHRNSAEYKVSLAAHPPTHRDPPDGPPALATGVTLKGEAVKPGPSERLPTASDEQPASTSTATSTTTGAGAGAAAATTTSSGAIALPDPAAPLASAQDFLAWFTSLSASITSATQTSHQRALADVAASTASVRSLLSQLESCQVNVSELRAGSAFVEDSSRDLRDEAQALLDSQLHLDVLSDDIVSRLSFFTLLPYATALLSSPDPSVVHSQEFLDLLDQLEMALVFLQQQPASAYRDAALYRMRYAQCVTRGATLAKLAVCRGMREAGDDLAARVKGVEDARTARDKDKDKGKGKGKERETQGAAGEASPLPDDLVDALYPSQSPLITKLRPLIHELERRAYPAAVDPTDPAADGGDSKADSPPSNAPEFESLLDECRSAWFAARRPILTKLVGSVIAGIEAAAAAAAATANDAAAGADAAGKSLERLSADGLSAIRWLVDREIEAYRGFFIAPAGRKATPLAAAAAPLDAEPQLKAYLQSFVDALQNRLRPRILKETRVGALARVCRVFLDHRTTPDQTSDQSPLAATSVLAHSLLHETQIRLIFRAQAAISGEIGTFAPKEDRGHLDFPEAIHAIKSRARNSSSLAVQRTSQHQRGKSGAGLLDAAAAMASSEATGSTSASRAGRDGSELRLFQLVEGSRSSYYPPVVALVDLLDQLQGLIAPKAFRELATEGVESCRKAVERGSDLLVKRRRGGVDREDGWLFCIRHYEILREVVVSVDLASQQQQGGHGASSTTAVATAAATATAAAATKEEEEEAQAAATMAASRSIVDLSSLTGAINSLWSSTGRLLYPSSDVGPAHGAAGARDDPRVNANLEAQLRSTIDAVAQLWSDAIVLPLRVYVDTHRAAAAAAAAREKVEGTLQALTTCIESVAEEKGDKARLWIEDDEVKRGLVEIVVQKVLLRYREFLGALGDHAGQVGAPSEDEVAGQVRTRFAGGDDERAA